MVKSEYWDEVRGASQAIRELHEETTDALAERGRGVRRPKTDEFYDSGLAQCTECDDLITKGRRLCGSCEQGEL